MAKLSDKIDISKAVKNANIVIDPSASMANPLMDSPEDLLESGVKAHRQRKSKKKSPVKKESTAEDNSLFAELLPQEEKPKQEMLGPMTYEETCENDIKRAHERGYPDPDFDFRKIYAKGQRKWFVRIIEPLGEKEMIEVILNTIYPRMIVAVQPKAFCHCIGYNMQDQLFDSPTEAKAFFDSVKVSKKYSTEPVRRNYNLEDEDDDMSVSQDDYDKLMQEGDEE